MIRKEHEATSLVTTPVRGDMTGLKKNWSDIEVANMKPKNSRILKYSKYECDKFFKHLLNRMNDQDIVQHTHTNFCCLFCSLIMRTCYAFMTCQLCFYYVEFSLEKLHVCLLILSEIWGCEDKRQLTPPMQSTACTTYYLFIFALVHTTSGNRYGL